MIPMDIGFNALLIIDNIDNLLMNAVVLPSFTSLLVMSVRRLK